MDTAFAYRFVNTRVANKNVHDSSGLLLMNACHSGNPLNRDVVTQFEEYENRTNASGTNTWKCLYEKQKTPKLHVSVYTRSIYIIWRRAVEKRGRRRRRRRRLFERVGMCTGRVTVRCRSCARTHLAPENQRPPPCRPDAHAHASPFSGSMGRLQEARGEEVTADRNPGGLCVPNDRYGGGRR